MCRDAHNAQQGCFHCPSSRTNLVASFSHRKLEPRATAQPLAAGVEPEISSWESVPLLVCRENLCAAMEPQPSSPASLGYSSCCGMGTIFIQLAAAEPSCLGVHGLGVMSAMPLATRTPLTLTSVLREAQRRSCWGRAKRRAETQEFNDSTDFFMCFQPLQLYLREKKSCWQEERRGKFTCAGKSGMCLDPLRAESQEQVYSKDRKADLARGIIFLLGTRELLITQVTSTI